MTALLHKLYLDTKSVANGAKHWKANLPKDGATLCDWFAALEEASCCATRWCTGEYRTDGMRR
jgi:hypothetical protein